jgi:carotenoid cleavage dioxygenase-like enzyme
VYAVGFVDPNSSNFLDRLIKVDLQTGAVSFYGSTPNAMFPGEALFVANPNPTAEDDGVLLTVVFDPVSELSSLVILNAQTLQEIGRASTPNLVPLGFHGMSSRGDVLLDVMSPSMVVLLIGRYYDDI